MSDSKKSVWDNYRKWEKISRITIPLFFGCFIFAERMPFLQVLASLCVAASGPAGLFRCPECGEFFFFKLGAFNWNFFPQKCVHCGLPKWAEPSPKPPKVLTYPIPSRESPRPDPAIADRLRVAKFLTLVLRDDPGAIHLTLDSDGWADVQNLLTRANRYGIKLDRENLIEIMNVPEEHRFEWDPPGDRVRAARE